MLERPQVLKSSSDAKPVFIENNAARVSAGVLIPGLVRDFGVDPENLLKEVGLPLDILSNTGNLIPFNKKAELFAAAASATQKENFGVMVGTSASLIHLGPLGLEMRKCRTIRAAWKRCSEAFRLQVHGAVLNIEVDGDAACIKYIITDPLVNSGSQISSGAIAFVTSMMRELCGPGWRPQLVSLPARQPANVTPFQAAFGSRVTFNNSCALLKFDAEWLVRAPYDPLGEAPLSLDRRSASPSDSVREEVARRLVTGACLNSSSVARALAMSRRTLYRRLAEEHATYQELVQAERIGLANRLLCDTDLSITEIAIIAGYSEGSAFSRAFNNSYGYSPRKARALFSRDRNEFSCPKKPRSSEFSGRLALA